MGNVESLITADKALMGGETNERNVDTKTQIETVKIGNGSVPVIEWRNQVVITTALLAQIYETDADNVKKNFSRHKDNFIEGTHYFLLQGEELCQFKNMVTNSPLVGKNANQLYLWTERGANRHCKILDTDKAWEQFDYLEEAYFNKDNLQKVPKDFAAALRLAADEYEKRMQLEQKNIELLADNQRMKPKEEFFDAVADSKDAIEIGKVAKVLNFPGIGRNKLFEILRKKGVLMKNNIPYQKYIDNGCFRTIEQKYSTPDGEIRISIKTLVYQKGVDFIRKTLILSHSPSMANAEGKPHKTQN